MGGRKGYSLKDVVGSTRQIQSNKKELLEGIKGNDPKKVVSASTRILAKSDKLLESLAHRFLFMGSIGKNDYEKLGKEDKKERRKELAKKWASYRKDAGKRFDAATNRDVVDSATKILGEKP